MKSIQSPHSTRNETNETPPSVGLSFDRTIVERATILNPTANLATPDVRELHSDAVVHKIGFVCRWSFMYVQTVYRVQGIVGHTPHANLFAVVTLVPSGLHRATTRRRRGRTKVWES